jgi:hypothetical protein
MNKKELDKWLKESELIDVADSEYDSCSNYMQTNIYQKNKKLYQLEIINNSFASKFIDGVVVYDPPIQVRKVVQKIEHIEYHPINMSNK